MEMGALPDLKTGVNLGMILKVSDFRTGRVRKSDTWIFIPFLNTLFSSKIFLASLLHLPFSKIESNCFEPPHPSPLPQGERVNGGVIKESFMKIIFCFAIILLFIFSLSPCFLQAFQANQRKAIAVEGVGDTRAPIIKEISLHELEKAALRYSDLESQEIHTWKSRAKWASALPRVMVGYEQKAAIQVNNSLQDSVSVTTSGVTVGPPESSLKQDNNFNRGFEVKAYWELSELVFSKDQIAISSEARYRQVMRSQVLEELQQAYFERKKLFIQMGDKATEEWTAGMRIRLEEIEAKLDSLTGGSFSKMKGEGR